MKINRQLLYKSYMDKVNDICDDLEWKTDFGPLEIVNIISDILEECAETLVEE